MATVKDKRPAEVGATAAGGISIVVVLQFIRQLWPDLLWDESGDAAVVAFVAFASGPLWAWLKKLRGGMGIAGALVLSVALLASGCITVTTTAPDGTVTTTQQIDMAALALMPGLIGDLGTELARIEAALDDTDESEAPTADELAQRERRQEILDRLLELGIEVISDNLNNDSASAGALSIDGGYSKDGTLRIYPSAESDDAIEYFEFDGEFWRGYSTSLNAVDSNA